MTEPTAATWVPNDLDFGSRLALVRHQMKWNVKEAARECGVPAATWRLWEEGASPRNLVASAMAIANRTGCDYLWLVHGPSKAMHQQRAQTTGWYVDELFAPSETSVPEGRVIHRDGRRNSQTRRSGRHNRRVRIATGTPPARASVN